MNLKYKILWIDDAEEWIESFNREVLDQYIKDEGFIPEFEIRSSPDDIEKFVDGGEFDLLVVDYNITENGKKCGDDIIKSVRENDCLTEVIFYSQNSVSSLRNKAAEKELDGVFFANRDQDSLLRKMQDVFDLTVRKVVDINNMRGIVLAGVADIDHLLADLITAIHLKLGDDQKTLHTKSILERMLPAAKSLKRLIADENHVSIKALHEAINALKELEPKSFEQLIKHRGFDSNKRVEAITSLCKAHNYLKTHQPKVEEIKFLLKWRNALAHQRPLRVGTDFVFEPTEGMPEKFDRQMTKTLRKRIMEHKEYLENLIMAVRE